MLRSPFPTDPHYDVKALELRLVQNMRGQIVSWHVAPEASPKNS